MFEYLPTGSRKAWMRRPMIGPSQIRTTAVDEKWLNVIPPRPLRVRNTNTTHKKHERSLEWRRKQLNALRRMCEENEDAMADALKKDLRRCYNTAVTWELWDIIAQVSRFVLSRW